MKEANRAEKRKKVAVSNSEREGVKRQTDATINAFVWFPELET